MNRGAVGESYTVPSHNDVCSRSRTMSLDCCPSLTTLQFTVIRCLLNSYFSLAVSVTVEDCWISDAFFSSCLWRELIYLIKEYFGRRPRLTYLQSTGAKPLFNSPVSLAVSVTVGHCSMSDVSLTSFLSRAFYSNATLAYLILFLASRSVAVGQCTMSDTTFDNPWRVRGR